MKRLVSGSKNTAAFLYFKGLHELGSARPVFDQDEAFQIIKASADCCDGDMKRWGELRFENMPLFIFIATLGLIRPPLREPWMGREAQVELLQYCLSLGADSQIKDHLGRTALHHILASGLSSADDPQFLNVFLDPLKDPNVYDQRGATLLHQAAGKGNVSQVDALISRGADVNFVAPGPLFSKRELVCEDPALHWTLFIACGRPVSQREGHLKVVKKLVECGADILKLDHVQRTAIEAARFLGLKEFESFLIEAQQVKAEKEALERVIMPQSSSLVSAEAKAEKDHSGATIKVFRL